MKNMRNALILTLAVLLLFTFGFPGTALAQEEGITTEEPMQEGILAEEPVSEAGQEAAVLEADPLEDATGPDISNISVDSTAVLTGETVTVSATNTDDSGVASAEVTLVAPSGDYATEQMVYDTETDVWSAAIPIDSSVTDTGLWSIKITAVDSVGNENTTMADNAFRVDIPVANFTLRIGAHSGTEIRYAGLDTIIYMDSTTPATATTDFTVTSSDESIVGDFAKIDGMRAFQFQQHKTGTVTITVSTNNGKLVKQIEYTVQAYPVTGLSVVPTTLTVKQGDKSPLALNMVTEWEYGQTVKWSSSTPSVATVSANGVVTGVNGGSAVITATVKEGPGLSAKCTVTVLPKDISSITLSSTALSLQRKKTHTLTASYLPSNALNKTLTWTSSNPKVATVTSGGKITAVAAGVADITVKAPSGATAKCRLTVTPIGVASVKIKAPAGTLAIGKTFTPVVTVSPSDADNRAVAWKTSDSRIATVAANGIVKGIRAGKATITATAKDGSGKTASYTLFVGKQVTKLTLNATTASILTGKTVALKTTITPSDAANKTITWTSSNPAVATVSSTGVVKGVKAGKATITATSADGRKKAAKCVVNVKQAVTGITLNTTVRTLSIGETYTLKATVAPASAANKAIVWKSSNPNVVKVSSNGVVRGLRKGGANITATSKDGSGKIITARIYVGAKVSDVRIFGNIGTLKIGATCRAYAMVAPSSAPCRTVIWKSSNPKVATVNNTGTIKAVGGGSARITATAVDGSGKSCSILITVPIPVSGIKLNYTTLRAPVGDYQFLSAVVSPSNAANQELKWTSSNPSVVVTDEYGSLKCVSEGSAVITARAKDGSGKSASCRVTVYVDPNSWFGADTYRVGKDIPAGKYLLKQTSTTMAYFCISSDAEGSNIIANDNFAGNSIVTVSNGQYIRLSRCEGAAFDQWGYTLAPVNGYYMEGMYQVGYHISPGTYQLTSTTTSMGYYEITSDASHRFGSIVSNKNFNGSVSVTLQDGQYIKLSRCKLKM